MAASGNITADGNTDTVYGTGPFWFKAQGTWGGGTFTIKYTYNGVTYDLVTTSAITSNATGEVLVDFPNFRPGQKIAVYGALSGSTSPNLNWAFIGQVSE